MQRGTSALSKRAILEALFGLQLVRSSRQRRRADDGGRLSAFAAGETIQFGGQLSVIECPGSFVGNSFADVSLQSIGVSDGSILASDQSLRIGKAVFFEAKGDLEITQEVQSSIFRLPIDKRLCQRPGGS